MTTLLLIAVCVWAAGVGLGLALLISDLIDLAPERAPGDTLHVVEPVLAILAWPAVVAWCLATGREL